MPIQNITHHYEEECSDDDADLKKIHKSVCAKRITNIVKNKKATRIIPPSAEKQKKLIN